MVGEREEGELRCVHSDQKDSTYVAPRVGVRLE